MTQESFGAAEPRSSQSPQWSAQASAEDAVRCGNCSRERLRSDVFWHEDDCEWYCLHIWICEARALILESKGMRGPVDDSKPGVRYSAPLVSVVSDDSQEPE